MVSVARTVRPDFIARRAFERSVSLDRRGLAGLDRERLRAVAVFPRASRSVPRHTAPASPSQTTRTLTRPLRSTRRLRLDLIFALARLDFACAPATPPWLRPAAGPSRRPRPCPCSSRHRRSAGRAEHAEVGQRALHELVARRLVDALEAEPGVDRVVGGDDAALLELLRPPVPAVDRDVRAGRRRADRPAGPVSVSKSLNSSVVVPSLSRRSSIHVPRPSVAQSVITLRRMSIFLPAYCERSTVQSVQPPELPVNACQAPVVPCGSQSGDQ